MDQSLFQQLSTSNDKDYQTLTTVTCIDPDTFLAVHHLAHQPLSCNTGSVEGMWLEMSPHIYDSSGAFDAVETLSTAITLEHSLPSDQHQQSYLNRTVCSSPGSRDLISTVGCPSVSTTSMSLTPITANDPAPDISFGSTTSPGENAAKRGKDRRRAQNRAAQRAFRARKEETIKENTVKVKSLEENLTCLQSANASLSDAVANLTAKVLRFQGENAMLKQLKTLL